ncbi:MAG: hypothetical protein V4793_14840 [Paraburkholderia tropica]|uniref:hypothetical protein n=1 Tax=Paraburkholderia tropica TaxID=92647 RepID=UPI0011B6CBC6|nr:hypothetical protein [Paraburkholderia tropica]MBB3003558.1 hypothetical protein [Paraburkholderia tropica]MBB6322532.1 hypothetical protein [Paraburkholderia tropica]MDE1144024.1 hypothetical protein [Paraburkholderia tropica]
MIDRNLHILHFHLHLQARQTYAVCTALVFIIIAALAGRLTSINCSWQGERAASGKAVLIRIAAKPSEHRCLQNVVQRKPAVPLNACNAESLSRISSDPPVVVFRRLLQVEVDQSRALTPALREN